MTMERSTAAPLRDNPLREQVLKSVAEAKYDEVLALVHGSVTGRRLQLHSDNLPHEHIRSVMVDQYVDIGRRLGADFLRDTPAVALEQFTIMAINRDHDTAGLLKSLINSFLIAYLTPETNSRAFDHLLELEALRGEVSHERQKGRRLQS